jgi:hypothetical protein
VRRAGALVTLLLTALLLTSAACVPEEGPLMEPGRDCMECHGNGGGEDQARRWTLAGTLVGHERRELLVVDATGKTFSLRINQVGNLWSSEPVTFPLRVSVDGVAMPNPVAAIDASCNRATGCHGTGGRGGRG